MRAMVLNEIVNLKENRAPLERVDLPDPAPRKGEVRVRVSTCGVCNT